MPRALGELELTLLFALLAEGPQAAGLDLRRAVRERSGRDLAPGAVYTALTRLEERGLVASRLEAGDEARGGRPRRRYTLEPQGATELRAAYRHMQTMARGLQAKLAGGGDAE
jgi:DNA-binding PadR family transcriptional regulator